MPGLVQGEVGLVTDGGSGIGRATALKLAQEGATVMIADYVQEGGERTVKMIKDADGAASVIHTDVSIARKSKRWSRKPSKPTAVDGAFNNAGIEGHVGAITVECRKKTSTARSRSISKACGAA
jgi:NAD(P)-dependent dehydrogenase (short-subunit alcohol dehydrogenase family)